MADGADDERTEELSSISAIFPELTIDPSQPFAASLDISVTPAVPLKVTFTTPAPLRTPPPTEPDSEYVPLPPADQHSLSYLPPLHLKVVLPGGYPDQKPPAVALSTNPPWLPWTTIDRLQNEVEVLWEDYGRGQTVYAYIDFLQQAAERGFDFNSDATTALRVLPGMRLQLLNFDATARREKFEKETFDCGVCLEPKKGTACYELSRCGHVFCKACLQEFYNNAIKEGDVSSVICLQPNCGKDKNDRAARGKKPRTLPPGELLLIPIEREMVQRYVDMKRKKQLESDKSTVYCPRQWCEGPARSEKYQKITDLSRMESWDDEDDETKPPSKPIQLTPDVDRLRICDDCSYAFCRTCNRSWHGEFVKCWQDVPLTEEELAARPMSEEDKLSYELILRSTSPCPVCESPVQKSEGCNHMTCYQCRTHFCYLCGTWLDPFDPYRHFSDKKLQCFGRLFDLVEGDDGDANVQFGGARQAEIMALLAEREGAANAEQGDGNAPPAEEPAPANQAADLAENLQQLDLNQDDAAEAAEPVVAEEPVENPLAEVDEELEPEQEQQPPAPAPVPAPRRPRYPPPPGGLEHLVGILYPPFRERPAGRPRRARRPNLPEMRGRRGDGPHPRFMGIPQHGGREGRALDEFLRRAQEDREDEWDSDELDGGGDDEEWAIPDAEDEPGEQQGEGP